jgi:hypothetical protein
MGTVSTGAGRGLLDPLFLDNQDLLSQPPYRGSLAVQHDGLRNVNRTLVVGNHHGDKK